MAEIDTPVRAAMTEPVRTVNAGLSVREVADVLLSEGIGSVVIDDGDRGVVTKTDLVAGLRDGVDPDDTPVAKLMTSPVVTVDADADLQEAVDTMRTRNVKRLPVRDGSDVVGMVTTTDLVEEVAVDLDTVVEMFAQGYTPTAPRRYECVRCGYRETSESRLGSCPECGEQMRNISVERE